MKLGIYKPLIRFALLAFGSGFCFKAKASSEFDFFEKQIRPLFHKHCYECHSTEGGKAKGGLVLDSREGWATGGDSGPAIVPGDASASLLIRAVSYSDGDLKMPPKYRLSETERAALAKWVESGAPDPRSGKVAKKTEEIDLAKGREFWSFRPVTNPVVPKVDAALGQGEPLGPIDRFVLSRLAAEGIGQVGLAKPDDGRLSILGSEDTSSPTLQGALGLTPQALSIYDDLTAEENLRFFGGMQRLAGKRLRERVDWVLEAVGLTGRRKDFVQTFSGGMKRRADLAKGLLHRPKLVLLDEPTNHLDMESKDTLEEALKAYEGSLVTVSHDRWFLDQVVNRIWEVNEGKVTVYYGNYTDYVRAKKGLPPLTEEEREELAEAEDEDLD